MRIKQTGKQGFLLWLKATQPKVYQQVAAHLQGGLQGFGDVAADASTGAASSSWTDTLKSLVNTYAQVYLTKSQLDLQKKATNLQLQRAAQGLAPLDIDTSSFTPKAQVGLDSGTSNLVKYGMIGAAVLGLLFFMKPHRGR